MCSIVDLSSRFWDFLPETTSGQTVPRSDQLTERLVLHRFGYQDEIRSLSSAGKKSYLI